MTACFMDDSVIYLIAGMLLSLVSISSGNEPQMSVDRNEVQVADPFHLTITVDAPPGTDIRFPPVTESIGLFQVVSHRDLFDIPVETGRSWTRIFELESYDSGKLEIPSMEIVVGSETKTTEPLSVTVQSLLDGAADVTKSRALKEVEDIPPESIPRWAWVIGIASPIALLVACAWFFIWRHKAPEFAESWAFAQLDALANTQAFQDKDQATVLPQAADILREYIQRRFDIAATQQTTEEFLQDVQQHPALSQQQEKELKGFLQLVDEIKFSHFVPATDRLSESFAGIRRFIEHRPPSESGDTEIAEAKTVEVAHLVEPSLATSEDGDDRFKPQPRGGTDGVAH